MTAKEAQETLNRWLDDEAAIRQRMVRAEGYTVHVGKQVATAEGRLVGHDGTLYAHASTTCPVFEVPPVVASRS